MIREAPRIETERLVLRALRAKDLEPLWAIWSNTDVVRYLGGNPLGREDTWRRTLAACGQWAVEGFGYWVVELRADGRVVGQLGFADFKREMEPSLEGLPELGYVFDTSVQGQGLAFEGCNGALEWAEANLRAQSYPAIISPENTVSIRLAEKLGFVREVETIYRDSPIVVFRRQG